MLIEKIDCFDLQPRERCVGDLPDVVRPAVETIARAVRVDAESKLRCNHYFMSERRERFSHQFFVCERTICLGSIKERDPALDSGTDDFDALLSPRRWPVVGTQPHAAKAKSRYLKPLFPKFR